MSYSREDIKFPSLHREIPLGIAQILVNPVRMQSQGARTDRRRNDHLFNDQVRRVNRVVLRLLSER